ncbi:radical SAM family enzyme [Vibrio ishigakensis]|uniref:Radical SAM family enzyme n=1 Tax=Vibrio ishigakensis TaxID=1481914 RepID=A0A0B8NVV6_9VIBR|nr:radical SAM family enzyme [Vibrio ishigakensis]
MEANPGTIEAERFAKYVEAGVTRISIGVQSFEQQKLERLGRIHGQDEAVNAAKLAHKIGLNCFNLDLMHGLPDQSIDQALRDLDKAIELAPPHLSWYQLTIEPNTMFYYKTPTLPMTMTYGISSNKGTRDSQTQAMCSTKSLATANQDINASTTSTTGALATIWGSAVVLTAS